MPHYLNYTRLFNGESKSQKALEACAANSNKP